MSVSTRDRNRLAYHHIKELIVDAKRGANAIDPSLVKCAEVFLECMDESAIASSMRYSPWTGGDSRTVEDEFYAEMEDHSKKAAICMANSGICGAKMPLRFRMKMWNSG
jgi:hypothetical protein